MDDEKAQNKIAIFQRELIIPFKMYAIKIEISGIAHIPLVSCRKGERRRDRCNLHLF